MGGSDGNAIALGRALPGPSVTGSEPIARAALTMAVPVTARSLPEPAPTAGRSQPPLIAPSSSAAAESTAIPRGSIVRAHRRHNSMNPDFAASEPKWCRRWWGPSASVFDKYLSNTARAKGTLVGSLRSAAARHFSSAGIILRQGSIQADQLDEGGFGFERGLDDGLGARWVE